MADSGTECLWLEANKLVQCSEVRGAYDDREARVWKWN